MLKEALGILFLGAMALPAAAQTVATANYPPPKNVGDPAQLGLGVQRTMALLATSTPQHHNTVRILFYGQSITEQDWWHEVAADLKRRFPERRSPHREPRARRLLLAAPGKDGGVGSLPVLSRPDDLPRLRRAHRL